jgi:hypothetical protein
MMSRYSSLVQIPLKVKTSTELWVYVFMEEQHTQLCVYMEPSFGKSIE